MNNFQELTDFLDKYEIKYIVNSDCVEVEGNLILHNNSLESLPESFGSLKIGGNLFLDKNSLKSLPDSFGNLRIGGGLGLSNNQLESLPDSFGSLKIGGGLWLHHNQLKSLPESFGNLKIGRDLDLSNNSLESLPESFGNLKIGGNLYLFSNSLKYLPESFGDLKIGGGLYLQNNSLESLPDSFGNLKIGGGLYLQNNSLESLPDSFGNLKIGGSLFLYNNSLKSLPEIPTMTETIEEDWCYIDGIVREIVSRKTLNDLTILKTPFDYIVGKDSTWSHGQTIQEATQDYHFKLMEADPDLLKDLDLDKPMTHEEAINIYRTVTRSCREGIRQWMSGKTFPELITIRQIVSLTEDAYGGSEFRSFFNL